MKLQEAESCQVLTGCSTREEDVGRILKQKSHSSNEHHSQEAVGLHKEEGMWHTQPH